MVGIDYSSTLGRWVAFHGDNPFDGMKSNIIVSSPDPDCLVCFLWDCGHTIMRVSDMAIEVILHHTLKSNMRTMAMEHLGI